MRSGFSVPAFRDFCSGVQGFLFQRSGFCVSPFRRSGFSVPAFKRSVFSVPAFHIPAFHVPGFSATPDPYCMYMIH